jgi:ADP-heptose:LPS heptosyltransferase
MNVGIFLSYKGIGANLLHLAYCHEIYKKYGPVTIITLCENLDQILTNDPKIKKIIYLKEYHKKFFDIFKLSKFFRTCNFTHFFIFYPSVRFFLASKIASIKNVYTYPLFKKKKLHLVHAAKKFTEHNLNIKDCPTESNIFITPDKKIISEFQLERSVRKIVIGAGSSGATTKWGELNYINLINKLNSKGNYFFYILCGPDEHQISETIINSIRGKNCLSFSQMTISEIIPTMSNCDLYIGNDSFGHHVCCQSGIPSIIVLLDTPSAYSDYSINQHRILPDGVSINEVDHNSAFAQDQIKVDKVYKKVLSLIN